MNGQHMINYRIHQTNLMDMNFHHEVVLIQITKIQIRLVVHRNINRNAIINIIDQSARLRLMTIVRMTATMIDINGRNTRNVGDRRRANVAIRRTRNQVDRISTPITVKRNGQFHGTGVVEVLRIQALSTSHGHVLSRKIGDHIIVISLNINKTVCKYELMFKRETEGKNEIGK